MILPVNRGIIKHELTFQLINKLFLDFLSDSWRIWSFEMRKPAFVYAITKRADQYARPSAHSDRLQKPR